jgi:hypothetical protein
VQIALGPLDCRAGLIGRDLSLAVPGGPRGDALCLGELAFSERRLGLAEETANSGGHVLDGSAIHGRPPMDWGNLAFDVASVGPRAGILTQLAIEVCGWSASPFQPQRDTPGANGSAPLGKAKLAALISAAR